MAAKQEIRAYPTRTNQIPRHIPPPHWASHPAVLYLAAGLLPFGTIFVELYFAMTSIWQVRKVIAQACHTAARLDAVNTQSGVPPLQRGCSIVCTANTLARYWQTRSRMPNAEQNRSLSVAHAYSHFLLGARQAARTSMSLCVFSCARSHCEGMRGEQ